MIYEQGFSATFLETPVELFLALEFLSGPPIAERVCLGDPCPMTLVYEALPPAQYLPGSVLCTIQDRGGWGQASTAKPRGASWGLAQEQPEPSQIITSRPSSTQRWSFS